MDKKPFSIFRASLLRCLGNPDFLELFHEEFVASSPEVAAVFVDTDIDRQVAMLNASLYRLMSLYESQDPSARKHVEELGATHGVYGHKIPLHLYDLWLESMLAAVRKCDSNFDQGVEESWLEVMSYGIGIMKGSRENVPSKGANDTASDALSDLAEELSRCSEEAAHRSNIEKDIEVTAFQFGQHRAYLHATELVRALLKRF